MEAAPSPATQGDNIATTDDNAMENAVALELQYKPIVSEYEQKVAEDARLRQGLEAQAQQLAQQLHAADQRARDRSTS